MADKIETDEQVSAEIDDVVEDLEGISEEVFEDEPDYNDLKDRLIGLQERLTACREYLEGKAA